MYTEKHLKSAKPADFSSELDLILIGKPGNGKSATANSILRTDEFKTNYNTESKVRYPQYSVGRIDGRAVQVVDCPGVIDTGIKNPGAAERVVRAIQNAFLANTPGYHAYLIVVNFGQRFLQEELDCIQILKTVMGENIIKSHGILVMSYGDTFKHHEVNERLTVEKFCREQEGAFKKLLNECSNRIVVFDNLTKDERIKQEQLQKLIYAIDQLKTSRHTVSSFEIAINLTESLQREKKFLLDQNLILQDILEAKPMQNNFDVLKKLKERSEKLIGEIENKREEKIDGEIISSLKINIKSTKEYLDDMLIAESKRGEQRKYDTNKTKFEKIQDEFKNIKKLADDGYFFKCLHQLEEKGNTLINECIKKVEKELAL